MQDPIANILSGYNSTVFIYGMTGAGKTYTMFNSINDSTERCDSSEGIVGMSINRLFDEIKQD
jgi:chromosomal replication initiation ATPase DnaA